MTVINFPDNPTINDIHEENGLKWIWTGITWDIFTDPEKTPVDIRYTSQANMIANQVNQTAGYIYYDGEVYWEYLGTSIGNISDYSQVGSSTGGGSGIEWIVINANITAQADKGYISNSTSRIEITLPLLNERKTIRIAGRGTGGWRLVVPNLITLVFIDIMINDWIQSTQQYDAIEVLCINENTYHVISSIGNLNYDIEL